MNHPDSAPITAAPTTAADTVSEPAAAAEAAAEVPAKASADTTADSYAALHAAALAADLSADAALLARRGTPQQAAGEAGTQRPQGPLVGLIMGSDSDWPTVEPAAEVLAEFSIPFEVGVVSAHRTPEHMLEYARTAHTRGIRVIIACAGGAAHLPGMVAAATPLPVIGIPRALGNLDGLDSLLSIVQMPGGVPCATVSIDGAKNAGLLAVRILSVGDPALVQRMVEYQESLRQQVLEKDRALRERLMGQ